MSEKHHAQVCPLRVLGVRWHGRSRAGVGNTLVSKVDYLAQLWRSVANIIESLRKMRGKLS
jgi:hypothetical protein